jgi:hypothetical protein
MHPRPPPPPNPPPPGPCPDGARHQGQERGRGAARGTGGTGWAMRVPKTVANPVPAPATGFRRLPWHGSWWQRSARAGETHAFPDSGRTWGGRLESEPPAPLQWQGPSPLPQSHADPRPAGGPKPPASARPAPGGRFSPAGSGADLCWCGWHGSSWQRLARAGETHAFPVPARSGTDRQTPNHQRRCQGRGHRPCHSATLTPGQLGAQSPRPAPAPPSAGASRPPGRALASVGAGGTGLGGTVARGRGNAVRFLFPPGAGRIDRLRTTSAVAMAGAIAPATAQR